MKKTLAMPWLAAALALVVAPALLQAQANGHGAGKGQTHAVEHAKGAESGHSANAHDSEDSKGKQPHHPEQGEASVSNAHAAPEGEHNQEHAEAPAANAHAGSAQGEEHHGPASRAPGWEKGKKVGWGGGDVPPGLSSPAGALNQQSLGDAARQIRENKAQAKNAASNASAGQRGPGKPQGGEQKSEGKRKKAADSPSGQKSKSD